MRHTAKGILLVAGLGGAYASARLIVCHSIGVAADFSARINEPIDSPASSAVLTRSRSTRPPVRLQRDLEIRKATNLDQVIDLREGADV